MTARSAVRRLLVSLPLMAPCVSAAETPGPTIELQTSQSEISETAIAAFDRERSESWDLQPEEWQRYRTLMSGIRGSVSPATLSPIEVLGIHARDDAERTRYARQWAVLMREDAGRILAFQHAYDAAQRQLSRGDPLIDTQVLKARRLAGKTSDGTALAPNDRIVLFARSDCPPCDAVLKRLLQRLPTVAGLDVFLVDVPTGDDQRIRDWAVSRQIDPELVRSRRVTLNHEAGALTQIAIPTEQLPLVLRRRAGVVSRLQAFEF